jgi:hypothetical protein
MPRFRLALVALALGCSSSTPPPATTPVEGSPSRPDALVLGELRVAGPEGTLFELHADGSVIVNGEGIGALGTDGRYVALGDDLVAEIDAEGKLVGRGRLMGVIAEDGTTTLTSGETIGFDATGKVEWNRSGVELRLEPPDAPAKRAAMMLIILLLG